MLLFLNFLKKKKLEIKPQQVKGNIQKPTKTNEQVAARKGEL
ncbi:hypothetical protein SAMN05877753_101413 [Bacillus oleivorans]|uniref:Uncharacterized protein n=1 Tax=Bacillus oleivorans TaxID=1448271 RepID=A0A285CJA6_9BACI|nr:hypothetical protein SAMN05877753_101413 [Bacillus oleivorans]